MSAQAISLILSCIQDRDNESMSIDEWMDYVDMIEAKMVGDNVEHCIIKHRFADGMYMREAFMPKGSLAVSNIHNTTHPLVILDGELRVRTHNGVKILSSGHLEITTPMTRRILYANLDTRFITFHALPDKDVKAIQDKILVKRTNPLLSKFQLMQICEGINRSNTI